MNSIPNWATIFVFLPLQITTARPSLLINKFDHPQSRFPRQISTDLTTLVMGLVHNLSLRGQEGEKVAKNLANIQQLDKIRQKHLKYSFLGQNSFSSYKKEYQWLTNKLLVASHDCLIFSKFEFLKIPLKFLWESYLHGILSTDFGR